MAREQAAGFWTVDQDISNQIAGHYDTFSATANKTLGDLDVKLMTSFRTFDNTGLAVSRGQPFEANTYVYGYPDYQSWQSELTVNGKALDNKLQWTTGLFLFYGAQPQ